MSSKTFQRIKSSFRRPKNPQSTVKQAFPKVGYTQFHPVAQCFRLLFLILVLCHSEKLTSDILSNPQAMLICLFVCVMAWPPRTSTALGKLELIAIFLALSFVAFRVMNPISH